jgi:hypothetical protein
MLLLLLLSSSASLLSGIFFVVVVVVVFVVVVAFEGNDDYNSDSLALEEQLYFIFPLVLLANATLLSRWSPNFGSQNNQSVMVCNSC